MGSLRHFTSDAIFGLKSVPKYAEGVCRKLSGGVEVRFW
jgi:hypothetical protein